MRTIGPSARFPGTGGAYDERQGRKLIVEVHSAVALDRQIRAEAATWLDRQLVGWRPLETAPAGFGSQVQQALQQRRLQLIGQRHPGQSSHQAPGFLPISSLAQHAIK